MKIYRSKKIWLVLMLSGVLLAPTGKAWANDRDDGYHGPRDKGRHEIVVSGRDRYNYRDGHFYKPGWFGFEFAINVPPFGVVVSNIPAGHKTVIVGNSRYYYYDRVYYQPCPSGYVVVPPPAVNANVVYVPAATPVPVASDGAITINVPNSDGSFTPVTLIARNGGYIGPQGEYYAGHPTVDQLRALYGK